LGLNNGRTFEYGKRQLPIVSVGTGVGIDYGIYLLSRICEEYQLHGARGCSFDIVKKAVLTTGKAIFFTAFMMILGVILWYLFSSLRFQAEMGLLLAVIMLINMLGALLLIPSILYVFKPKILGKFVLKAA
jgi:predicted RND superfamily exporter protein